MWGSSTTGNLLHLGPGCGAGDKGEEGPPTSDLQGIGSDSLLASAQLGGDLFSLWFLKWDNSYKESLLRLLR